ncbi:MAG TPA: hypothetical protein VEA69_16390 [Tepidisphaeraceae bacterium]|nr:hypothetical protein [Tepidisphaeraceae bacterium]
MSIPLKDSLLASYAANVGARLAAAGTSVYRLPADLVAAYAAAAGAFAAAYEQLMTSREAGVRSEAQTCVKEATKRALVDVARQVYATVAADAQIADSDKVLIGVHVRAGRRAAIPRPTSRPALDVGPVVARTVALAIHDASTPSRRGRPPGAAAAWVYSFAGPAYPADPAAWRFVGAATGPKLTVTFPPDLPPGTPVWLRACWVNPRQEAGPMGEPVMTPLQFGGTLGAAARSLRPAA